jgi:dethiobiotin synthase
MIVHCVTGTDTEVGKTVVTAALAAVYRGRGLSVAVVKPAQTGVVDGEPGDVHEVLRLAGPVTVREGTRLPAPLAPDRAALLAGVTLPSLVAQRHLVHSTRASHDLVLVEGAGGITVNLGPSFTLLDIAAGMPRVSFVVVARAGLGTLNHSALTVQAIRRRGFEVSGVVIGSWPGDPGLAERHNREDLPRYTGVPLLGAVPEGASRLDPGQFQAYAPSWLPGV